MRGARHPGTMSCRFLRPRSSNNCSRGLRRSRRSIGRADRDWYSSPLNMSLARRMRRLEQSTRDLQRYFPPFSTYFLVLLLIVIVAAFNIIATLVMVVMERRKEIAILRAMGALASSVAAIFLTEGALLGVIGTGLGTGGGFLCSWAIGKYHLIRLPADLFMISYVPVRIYPMNFILVAVASIVLCVVAALYPALKARS